MRIGCTAVVAADRPLGALRDDALRVEELGLDLLWLDQRRGIAAPLVWAAALAGTTAQLRIAAAVAVGEVTPLYVAEEAAVADLALGGRLVLGAYPAAGAVSRFPEAAELLLRALAPRPFRHEGEHWRVPAGLPGNRFNVEERVRVTPAPAQLELPLWLLGPTAVAVAPPLGLPPVIEGGDGSAWTAVEQALGAAALRLRRPALLEVDVAPDGELDDEALVTRLQAAEREWGLDVAVVVLAAGLEPSARARALRTLARRVRPRVQLDRLPPGLEEHWDGTLQEVQQ